mgnify:CR=1 FL=1
MYLDPRFGSFKIIQQIQSISPEGKYLFETYNVTVDELIEEDFPEVFDILGDNVAQIKPVFTSKEMSRLKL